MQNKIRFLLVLLAFSLLCLNLFAKTSAQPVGINVYNNNKQTVTFKEVQQFGEDILKKFFSNTVTF